MPGVQTILQVMLHHLKNEKIELPSIVKFLCEAPAKLYNLKDRGRLEKGLKADLLLLDLSKIETISNQEMQSKCGWTPFHGLEYQGKINEVIFNGECVVRDNKSLKRTWGRPIKYKK